MYDNQTATQSNSRRDFLVGAATFFAAQALSPLEAAAASTDNGEIRSTNDISHSLLNILKHNTTNLGSGGYRRLYEDYEGVINDIRFSRNSLKAPKLSDVGIYDGLEVVALMHEADLLRIAGNNIIVEGEKIDIVGMPTLKSDRRLNDAWKYLNNLKSLQNYIRVEEIWQRANNGKNLPQSVGVGILGSYGDVAKSDLFYKKMKYVVDDLLDGDLAKKAPKKYKNFLESKKKYVEQRLPRLAKN